MDGHQLGDSLQLHDDDRVDKQVGAIPDLDANVIVLDRQRVLNEDGHSALAQLMGDTGFLRPFQKSGSKPGMDPHRGVDYLPSSDIDLSRVYDDLDPAT